MNTKGIVAIVAIAVLVGGLVFVGFGVNSSPAPAAPAPDQATLVTTSTATSTGGRNIQMGPVADEPEIPPGETIVTSTLPNHGQPTPTPSSGGTTPTPVQPAPEPSVPLSPSAHLEKDFTIHANDESADLTQITVPKGTPVFITFVVSSTGTYYGGLDFRSTVLSTGTITPGNSKTVNFTADSSFSFTPYWPASNIAKPYKINVTVQ